MKYFSILLIICCIQLSSTGQTSEKKHNISGFINYRTPLTVQGGFELNEKIGITLNYSHNIKEYSYYSGGIYSLIRSFNRRGPGIGSYYQFKINENSPSNLFRFGVEYNFLKSGNFTEDPGKFSGSSMSSYSKFKEYYHSFSILAALVVESKSKRFRYFSEAGFQFKNITRKYLVTGAFNDRYTSNSEEKLFRNGISLRVGISVKLFD